MRHNYSVMQVLTVLSGVARQPVGLVRIMMQGCVICLKALQAFLQAAAPLK